MFLGFGYLYIFVMLWLFFFFFKKAENNRFLKKPKFRNIIFLFLLKIRSRGPVHQQINLVSPYELFCHV